jgi:hypothetical protein
LVLEENGLLKLAEGKVATPADPIQLPAHAKKDVKAKRILVDGVKDQIIPLLPGKKTAREMWEALVKIYQSDNQSRKMLFTEKHEDDQGRVGSRLPHKVHSDSR